MADIAVVILVFIFGFTLGFLIRGYVDVVPEEKEPIVKELKDWREK